MLYTVHWALMAPMAPPPPLSSFLLLLADSHSVLEYLGKNSYIYNIGLTILTNCKIKVLYKKPKILWRITCH